MFPSSSHLTNQVQPQTWQASSSSATPTASGSQIPSHIPDLNRPHRITLAAAPEGLHGNNPYTITVLPFKEPHALASGKLSHNEALKMLQKMASVSQDTYVMWPLSAKTDRELIWTHEGSDSEGNPSNMTICLNINQHDEVYGMNVTMRSNVWGVVERSADFASQPVPLRVPVPVRRPKRFDVAALEASVVNASSRLGDQITTQAELPTVATDAQRHLTSAEYPPQGAGNPNFDQRIHALMGGLALPGDIPSVHPTQDVALRASLFEALTRNTFTIHELSALTYAQLESRSPDMDSGCRAMIEAWKARHPGNTPASWVFADEVGNPMSLEQIQHELDSMEHWTEM